MTRFYRCKRCWQLYGVGITDAAPIPWWCQCKGEIEAFYGIDMGPMERPGVTATSPTGGPYPAHFVYL